MALSLSYRRNVLIVILLLLLLGAFAAVGDQWIGWAFVIGVVAVLLVIDFMFGARAAGVCVGRAHTRALASNVAGLRARSYTLLLPHR